MMIVRGALGCGALLTAMFISACGPGSGSVALGGLGDGRDPAQTGRDAPPGTGASTGSTETHDEKGTGAGSSTGTGTSTGTKDAGTATPAPTSSCPKCTKYECSGNVMGKPFTGTFDFNEVSGGGCEDKEQGLGLTCDGKLTSAGAVSGSWMAAGSSVKVMAGSDALTCNPK